MSWEDAPGVDEAGFPFVPANAASGLARADQTFFDAGAFEASACDLNGGSGPEGRKARAEMFGKVAGLVPFVDRPTASSSSSGPGVIPFSEAIERKKVSRGDHALQLWSATDEGPLWETPLGRAVAAFCMHRYGLTRSEAKNDKLHHGTEVLFHANEIHKQQSASAGRPVLSPTWRGYLEFASVLHDIGYVNGGRGHAGTGGQDVFELLPAYLERLGVDPLPRHEIEKMGTLIQLHSTQFPWNKMDKRLASSLYVHVDVVQQVLGQEDRDTLRSVLREENRAYLSRGAPGEERLAWLDDDGELAELLSAGWILHCADNYNGPSSPPADPLKEAPKPRGSQRLGKEAPIEDLSTFVNHFRAVELKAAVKSGATAIAKPVKDALSLLDRPFELKRKLKAEGLTEKEVDAVVASIDKGALAELRSLSLALSKALDALADTAPTQSSSAVAEALTSVTPKVGETPVDMEGWLSLVTAALERAAAPIIAAGVLDAGELEAKTRAALSEARASVSRVPDLPSPV